MLSEAIEVWPRSEGQSFMEPIVRNDQRWERFATYSSSATFRGSPFDPAIEN